MNPAKTSLGITTILRLDLFSDYYKTKNPLTNLRQPGPKPGTLPTALHPEKHWLETSVVFKCGAKVRIILELSKFLRNFLHHYRNFLYFCGKEYLFSRLFLYLLNPALRILGIRIQVEGFLVVGYCSFVHLLALTFLTHYGIFHR